MRRVFGRRMSERKKSAHGEPVEPGFTIFEVLMAMGILTVAIAIAGRLQVRALLRTLNDRDNIEKMYQIKSQLVSWLLKDGGKGKEKSKKNTVKLDNADVTLATQANAIASKSSLALLKDRLIMVQTNAKWTYDNASKQLSLETFVYKPPEEEKEKKR